MALRKRRSAADYSYDSGDDVDLSQFGKNSSYTSVTSETWLRRIFTVITTFFSSIYTRTTSIFRRKQSGNFYYSRYAVQEKRGKHSRPFSFPNLNFIKYISPLPPIFAGIFRRIGQSISNGVTTVFRYIYLVISSVLFLDSWLLRSSNVSGGKKKGLLIGLLVLLPLLLIGGKFESHLFHFSQHFNGTSRWMQFFNFNFSIRHIHIHSMKNKFSIFFLIIQFYTILQVHTIISISQLPFPI